MNSLKKNTVLRSVILIGTIGFGVGLSQKTIAKPGLHQIPSNIHMSINDGRGVTAVIGQQVIRKPLSASNLISNLGIESRVVPGLKDFVAIQEDNQPAGILNVVIEHSMESKTGNEAISQVLAGVNGLEITEQSRMQAISNLRCGVVVQ